MSLCCVLLLCAMLCAIYIIYIIRWYVQYMLFSYGLFPESSVCSSSVPQFSVLKKEECCSLAIQCWEALSVLQSAKRSNSQTCCSTECKDKVVTVTDWCCLSCLKHVDNLVSREEKQILWKIEGGELMSKLMSGKGKQELICGRRTEIDHCHKGTTELLRIKLI